ncbi:unnamed protein product, partial [Rotaria sordida]
KTNDSYNPYFELVEISIKRGTLSFGNHDNKQTSSDFVSRFIFELTSLLLFDVIAGFEFIDCVQLNKRFLRNLYTNTRLQSDPFENLIQSIM